MTIINRFAARGILLTQQNEVLLMKLQNPETGVEFWVMPGGGIEQDEEPKAALKRELYEELGLDGAEIGAHVWKREHYFKWEGAEIYQNELFYTVRVEKFTPTSEHMPAGPELRAFRSFRWWTLEELEETIEVFAPRNISDLLRRLVENGDPPDAIQVGT